MKWIASNSVLRFLKYSPRLFATICDFRNCFVFSWHWVHQWEWSFKLNEEIQQVIRQHSHSLRILFKRWLLMLIQCGFCNAVLIFFVLSRNDEQKPIADILIIFRLGRAILQNWFKGSQIMRVQVVDSILSLNYGVGLWGSNLHLQRL